MKLKDYSTETLIKYLRKNRGVKIPSYMLPEYVKLKPYFGKVDETTYEDIERWDGHYGLTQNGDLCLCTPDGKRIFAGTILTICKDGSISRRISFRDDTIIPVDEKGRVIIEDI